MAVSCLSIKGNLSSKKYNKNSISGNIINIVAGNANWIKSKNRLK
jgi:hypothetical protein